MEDRIARLEAAVGALRLRVADLEERLAHGEYTASAQGAEPFRDPLTAAAEISSRSFQHWLALAGRTLVVLGGAYLLRAITESRVVAPEVGVALGLVYGAPWLLLASRAEGRGAHLDALCHALATALIGYPLVWEATVRFHVLTPPQSAGLVAALTGAALVLSSRRQLQSLAWVVTFGALGSAIGLAAATSSWVPYTLVSIGVGLATLWLGYLHGWNELRWLPALAANFMLFIATGRAAVHGGAGSVLWLQGLMLVGYLGSFAARTAFRSNHLVPFEVAQSAGVLAVGYGGLVYLLFDSSHGLEMLSAASLIAAVTTYASAFGFSERHRAPASFVFHSMVGFFFTLAGLMVGLGAAVASIVCAVLAMVALGLARQHHRLTLMLHAALYALAACIVSGLLMNATIAMTAPGVAGVVRPGVFPLAAFAAVLAVAALPLKDTRERWPYVVSVARLIVSTVAIVSVVGILVAALLELMPVAIDPSQLSTIRTIVLVIAALAVAAAGRRPGGREAAWLAYPLLFLAGLKLVFVDFIGGRPTTLFAALAVYGAALIVAPRLLRREPIQREDASVDAVLAPITSVPRRTAAR
jgi:hypothetical protein